MQIFVFILSFFVPITKISWGIFTYQNRILPFYRHICNLFKCDESNFNYRTTNLYNGLLFCPYFIGVFLIPFFPEMKKSHKMGIFSNYFSNSYKFIDDMYNFNEKNEDHCATSNNPHHFSFVLPIK